jgi:hypothetical protein
MRYLIPSMALGLLLVTTNSGPVQAQATESKAKQAESPRQPKLIKIEKKAVATGGSDPQIIVTRNILDDLLAQALKDNPDIRVAESKLREAEAELNRVRLQVSQKLVAQQREIAVSKAAMQQAEADYARITALVKTGAGSQEMLNSVAARLQQIKAELARLEADLPYLLGSPAGVRQRAYTAIYGGKMKSVQKSNSTDAKSAQQAQDQQGEETLRERSMETLRREVDEFVLKEQLKTAGERIEFMPPSLAVIVRNRPLPPAMADKIRKALDTPVKVDFNQTTPKDILDFLQDHTKGFNLVDQVHIDKAAPVTLRLSEPVPVGAVFQFLEDQYAWRFVIREYGIVVAQAGRVPPGAVNLQTFWKDRPGQAITSPAATGKN